MRIWGVGLMVSLRKLSADVCSLTLFQRWRGTPSTQFNGPSMGALGERIIVVRTVRHKDVHCRLGLGMCCMHLCRAKPTADLELGYARASITLAKGTTLNLTGLIGHCVLRDEYTDGPSPLSISAQKIAPSG